MNLLEAGYDYRCVGSVFADWCIRLCMLKGPWVPVRSESA